MDLIPRVQNLKTTGCVWCYLDGEKKMLNQLLRLNCGGVPPGVSLLRRTEAGMKFRSGSKGVLMNHVHCNMTQHVKPRGGRCSRRLCPARFCEELCGALEKPQDFCGTLWFMLVHAEELKPSGRDPDRTTTEQVVWFRVHQMASMYNASTNDSVCYYNQTTMFFYNLSGRDLVFEAKYYKSVGVFTGVLFTSISIIFLNGLVLLAIALNRRLHFPFYYLLGNLAVTDLCVGISYLVITCLSGVWTSTISTGWWFFRQGLTDTSLLASLMNLMAIALERQQAIFTMQLHSRMSSRRILLLILGVWIIAVLIGLSPFMGWNCICDVSSCSQTLPLFSRSYVLTISVLSLLIMFTVVVLYVCIFVYVWRKSRRMREHTSEGHGNDTVVSLMKTVLLILGFFVLCWTPALVLLLLDGLDHVPQKLLVVESLILTLVACNSFLNPIIYTYRDQEVRGTFRRIFCCSCPPRQ
ncbi:hypothetical protein NFI96_027694 [Prochilodus magdalenae]|nr:hypothetical protein NFI96_027694 [Prochilodus magdalenae]